jgi:DNA-3-methyladenine glycosylase I
MQSYCSFARSRTDVHREHHDTEHGVLPKDDNDLFRRLVLEISQAGLSFETVLKRKQGIYRAFGSVDRVAKFGAAQVRKLMLDASIIRNRLKILAAIHNAQKVKELQREFGSFRQWLDAHHPRTREGWVKLFKKTFTFTGGEIVNEFLMSTGHLPGAHDADCPMFKKSRKS